MKERFELFTLLISKISRSIRRIKTEQMEEFNLKSSHVSCLYYIYKKDRLTAKELCDICDEDKALISRSLDYLENNGFLECDSSLKKRYRSYLTLTIKGKEVAKEICKKIDGFLEIASEGLTEEDRIVLYKSLNLINNNLNEYLNKEKGE